MDEPITFIFIPTEKDYSKTLWALSYRNTRTAIVIGIWVVLTALALWAFFRGELGSGFFPGGIFLLALVVFILTFLLTPLRARLQVRKNPGYTNPVTWQMDDNEIIVKNGDVESKFSWNTFSRIREIPDYYLFIFASYPRMYQFIPKRAFSSPEQEEKFRNLIKEHGRTII